MKTPLLLLVALTAPLLCAAQEITLKDGSVIATKGVRRAGNTIMATMQLPTIPGQRSPGTGEFGYPIASIANINFPEPGALISAVEAINAGKPQEGLREIQSVLSYYDGFRDVPGSWWAEATLMKVQALIRMGEMDQAEALARQMASLATDPDSISAANVYIAAALAREGEYEKARQTYDGILQSATRSQSLAAAALCKGQAYLAQEEWVPALLSILEVPVFHPDQKMLMPDVLLGSAQAYIGLTDFKRAKTTLDTLDATYPQTPEAAQSKLERARMARLEAANHPEE